MCIILACKAGKRPTAEVLENCWDNNPDGAGVMYASGGVVHGHKGLMTFEELGRVLGSVPEDVPLAVHFRIGTSGGYGPGVTHPYPVSSAIGDLHATEWESPVGIAHNGVINGMRTDNSAGVSDTVAYIRDVVAPLSSVKGGDLACHKAVDRLSATSKGSRLCVLEGDGEFVLTGSGWNQVCDGVSASNSSWRYSKPAVYRYTVPKRAANRLPGSCRGCDLAGWCRNDVPGCSDVAMLMGYPYDDFAMFWGLEEEVGTDA